MKGQNGLGLLIVAALLFEYGVKNSQNLETSYNSTKKSIILLKQFVIGKPGSNVVFGVLRNLDVDSEGNIFVADYSFHQIKVFKGNGSPNGTIGREGKGPGEFEQLGNVQVGRNDSVFAFDFGLRRITVFAPNHDHRVAYIAPVYVQGEQPIEIIVPYRKNGFLVRTTIPFLPSLGPKEGENFIRWVGSSSEKPVLSLPPAEFIVDRKGGAMIVTEMPFGREAMVRIGYDDRLYYGYTDSLAISIYSVGGRLLGHFSLPFQNRKVTRKDINKALESYPGQVADIIRRAQLLSRATLFPRRRAA